MDVLTFFAFPIATIILAFTLEKIVRNPLLTALSFFAVYLVIAFTIYDSSFLPFGIVYTLLAYISALIAEYLYSNNDSNSNISDEEIEEIAQRVVSIISNRNSCRTR